MTQSDEAQERAREFLLGYLDESERVKVEERILTENAYREIVLQAESALIEDYLEDELSAEDRVRCEKNVLTNELQLEQLSLTRALKASAKVNAAANSPPTAERIARPTPEERPSNFFQARDRGMNWAVAAMIALVLIGVAAIVLFYNRSYRNNDQAGSLGEELAKLNAEENLDSQAILRGYIIGPLKPGLSRDEENSKAFVIPGTEQIIQLRLQIGSIQYQTFQAELLTAEDEKIATLIDLKEKRISGERMVIVYLPARRLTSGDYQIKLNGVSQNNQLVYVGRYTFRIVGK